MHFGFGKGTLSACTCGAAGLQLCAAQQIVCAHAIKVRKRYKMVHGYLLHAAFVFRILLLSGVQKRAYCRLRFIGIFAHIAQARIVEHNK